MTALSAHASEVPGNRIYAPQGFFTGRLLPSDADYRCYKGLLELYEHISSLSSFSLRAFWSLFFVAQAGCLIALCFALFHLHFHFLWNSFLERRPGVFRINRSYYRFQTLSFFFKLPKLPVLSFKPLLNPFVVRGCSLPAPSPLDSSISCSPQGFPHKLTTMGTTTPVPVM